MQGWIKLHRRIKEHWLYQEKRKFTKFEAWIDLLLEVNHKDNKFVLGSELVEVKRGQTITSIRQLCDKWGWSNSKVTQFLKMLEKDGMATVKSDTKKTVITIDNYEVYQVKATEETTENRHEQDRKQTQKHTNKNDKNVKNDKEKIYRQFKHLSITEKEFERLMNEGYTKEQIDDVLDSIENFAKNKQYTNLLLTARNWLKRSVGKPKLQKKKDPLVERINFLKGELSKGFEWYSDHNEEDIYNRLDKELKELEQQLRDRKTAS